MSNRKRKNGLPEGYIIKNITVYAPAEVFEKVEKQATFDARSMPFTYGMLLEEITNHYHGTSYLVKGNTVISKKTN